MLLLAASLVLLKTAQAQCPAGKGAVSLDVSTGCTKVVLSGFTDTATDSNINGEYDWQQYTATCFANGDLADCGGTTEAKRFYCPDIDNDGTFDSNTECDPQPCSGDILWCVNQTCNMRGKNVTEQLRHCCSFFSNASIPSVWRPATFPPCTRTCAHAFRTCGNVLRTRII